MVKSITSVGNSGLSDWLLQRVSALLMLVYLCVLAGYFYHHPHPAQIDWRQLFTHSWMPILTFLVVFSLILHAWIGLWIVFTDYIKQTTLRLTMQILVIFVLLACLIWTVEILWGI